MSEERAFRRLVHTFTTVFVAYYLIPVGERLPWKVLAVALFSVAATVEACRLAGLLPRRRVYGMREYETRRPASYLYFGAGTLPLLLWAPEQITIPCLLCAGIGDPLIGEVRLHVGPWPAAVVGLTTGTVFFLIVAVPVPLALLGGVAFVAAESLNNPWLDDDLLNQAVPALVLAGLSLVGTWTPRTVFDTISLEGA